MITIAESRTEQLTVEDDVVLAADLKGDIDLGDHTLTVTAAGDVVGTVSVGTLIIYGRVRGRVSATRQVVIHDGGSLEGDVSCPRVSIAEGATFRGSVDLARRTARVTPERIRVDVIVPEHDPEAKQHLAALRSAITNLLTSAGFAPEDPRRSAATVAAGREAHAH